MTHIGFCTEQNITGSLKGEYSAQRIPCAQIIMAIKNVLIIEDHPVFRHGLRSILQDLPEEFKVVGEAETGRKAVALTRQFHPDIVLMDIHIPEMDGIEATRAIQRIAESSAKRIAVLIVTFADDDESLFAALRAGAKGYVLKGDGLEEILQTIRVVANGGAVFGPSIAARIQSFFTHLSAEETIARRYPKLTKRECDVLGYVQKRYKNNQIAAALDLKPKTVRNHITNILNKLQVATRSDLIDKASDSGSAGDHFEDE
jgi:DNA-binding NarL/FixJ family response regulator